MARLADFLATVVFLAADFFDGARLEPAATFLEAALVDAVFEVFLLSAPDFLSTTDFFDDAAFLLAGRPTLEAPPIRNFERSFALASQAGAGPRPLQVAPVLGS
jgi:hypothetical protein